MEANQNWEQICRLVEPLLSPSESEANKLRLPTDASDETILSQIKRGNKFPSSRLKAWRHILLELEYCQCSENKDRNNENDDFLSLFVKKLSNLAPSNDECHSKNTTTLNEETTTTSSSTSTGASDDSVIENETNHIGGGGATACFALRAAQPRHDINNGNSFMTDTAVLTRTMIVAGEEEEDLLKTKVSEVTDEKKPIMKTEVTPNMSTVATLPSLLSLPTTKKPSTAPGGRPTTIAKGDNTSSLATKNDETPRPSSQPSVSGGTSSKRQQQQNYQEIIDALSSKTKLTMLERQSLWMAKKSLKSEERSLAAKMAEVAMMQSKPNITKSRKSFSSKVSSSSAKSYVVTGGVTKKTALATTKDKENTKSIDVEEAVCRSSITTVTPTASSSSSSPVVTSALTNITTDRRDAHSCRHYERKC